MKNIMAFSFILILLTFAGCVTEPIEDIHNAPVYITKPDYTPEDVEKGIMRAGLGMGWHMVKVAPGTIEGVLYKTPHIVVVTISYTTHEYSIIYKNSENMKYSSGRIHQAYNRWIKELSTGIQMLLASQR